MGVRLFNEVLRRAPAGLTKGERLVLFVCAWNFNDDSRAGWPGEELLTTGTDMTPRGVRKAIDGLVDRGVVERIPLGHDKTGRPIYAHSGRRARYRIAELIHSPPEKEEPPFPLPDDEGGTPVPPSEGERRNQRAEKAEPASKKAEPGFPRQVISSQRSSQISARATTDDLAAVIEAVHNRTGTRIDRDHANRIVSQVLDGRAGIRAPARYAAAAIQRDEHPERFLPTPTPPPFRHPDDRTPR